MAFSLTTRRWLAPLAALAALTGCRAIIGVEDFTAESDAGTSADAASDGASFAACALTCGVNNPSGQQAFSSSLEGCLCQNKVPRTCPAECTLFCDNGGGTPPAACRACVLTQLASGGVCATSCQGGSSGPCANFVNCVKACPK